MNKNYLKGRQGDHINAVLAAAGYDFRRIAQQLKDVLRRFLMALACRINHYPA